MLLIPMLCVSKANATFILILCQNSFAIKVPQNMDFLKLPFMCELPFIASGVIKDEVTEVAPWSWV